MSFDVVWMLRLCGITAMVGAALYWAGDVLLLAKQFVPEDYPRLQPHLKLLSGMERMAGLSWRRMAWGGLLGVFAAPLLLAGNWQVFLGLSPAGTGLALPPLVLLVWAGVVGVFGHGTFIYIGETVQALNQVDEQSEPVLVGIFNRMRKIMLPVYVFLLGSIILASGWYAALVAGGGTAFPRWMAAVNPVTAFLAWTVVKRALPRKTRDYTEGAGFNIAYFIFYLFTTWTLWEG